MRIPLTKYGLPQVAVFPALVLLLMAAVFLLAKGRVHIAVTITVELLLTIVLVWVLAFFRDPYRQIPSETNILLSPADGVVTDIEVVDDETILGEKALRIGIFLNIFNVHINRAPCRAKVERTDYKKGRFINAMDRQSSKVNESNDILMTRLDEPADRLLVRQISGAIARRIVCRTKSGDTLASGQKFGMIKFGSRTELYLPIRQQAKCRVKVSDKVKAGLTVLVRYE
jgi:phosphatidylserine decarboxylase